MEKREVGRRRGRGYGKKGGREEEEKGVWKKGREGGRRRRRRGYEKKGGREEGKGV